MAFAIVGVLAFQGLWLRDSYKTRKEAFRQSVNDALQMAIEDEKAVKTIRNMSTVIWQDNKPDTAFHIEEHFIYAPGDTTKDVTVISSPSIAYFSSDSLLDMSVSVNADSMLAMGKKISATISQEINDNEFLSSTDYSIDFDVDELYDFQEDMEALDNIEVELKEASVELEDMVRNVIITFGSQSVNAGRLDSLYKVRLSDRGITSSYILTVVENERKESDAKRLIQQLSADDSGGKNSSDMLPGETPDADLIIEQPVNRFRSDKSIVRVSFPSPGRYLLSQMWLSLAGALLLVATVIFILFYMLSTILRQKRLSEMKNDFVNNMTHELKTPVAAVSAALEGMENFNVLEDREKSLEYIRMSRNELHRLNGMIEHVLQVAKREKEGLTIHNKPVDLHQLAEEIITSFKLQSHDTEFTLKCPAPFMVTLDRMHIQNTLNNLIDNAVKYNSAATAKKVEVSIFSFHNETIIEVKDNGPGIPKQYQKYLYNKFYRVPTGNIHNVKGFGLGLHYVASVVAAYGGSIKLASESSEGSAFTIYIPEVTHE